MEPKDLVCEHTKESGVPCGELAVWAIVSPDDDNIYACAKHLGLLVPAWRDVYELCRVTQDKGD